MDFLPHTCLPGLPQCGLGDSPTHGLEAGTQAASLAPAHTLPATVLRFTGEKRAPW